MTAKIAALILAAGQSQRFNDIKQLAMIDGKPLINRVIAEYQQVGFDTVRVVLGAHADKIRTVLPNNVDVCFNADWQQGMGNSLAAAIKSLDSSFSHVFVGLADQVAISEPDIKQYIDTSEQYPQSIVAANYGQSFGVPAMFCKQDFVLLKKLQGDSGAKQIIQQNLHRLQLVNLPQAAIDIDTQADLYQWQQIQQEEIK